MLNDLDFINITLKDFPEALEQCMKGIASDYCSEWSEPY